ncbi:MAG: hypothetical protein Q6351_001855 [Candidatus Njordarchaeum guaymaensis]
MMPEFFSKYELEIAEDKLKKIKKILQSYINEDPDIKYITIATQEGFPLVESGDDKYRNANLGTFVAIFFSMARNISNSLNIENESFISIDFGRHRFYIKGFEDKIAIGIVASKRSRTKANKIISQIAEQVVPILEED